MSLNYYSFFSSQLCSLLHESSTFLLLHRLQSFIVFHALVQTGLLVVQLFLPGLKFAQCVGYLLLELALSSVELCFQCAVRHPTSINHQALAPTGVFQLSVEGGHQLVQCGDFFFGLGRLEPAVRVKLLLEAGVPALEARDLFPGVGKCLQE